MTREVRRRLGAIATAAAMALGVPNAVEKQTSFVIDDTALNVS